MAKQYQQPGEQVEIKLHNKDLQYRQLKLKATQFNPEVSNSG